MYILFTIHMAYITTYLYWNCVNYYIVCDKDDNHDEEESNEKRMQSDNDDNRIGSDEGEVMKIIILITNFGKLIYVIDCEIFFFFINFTFFS